MLRTISMVLAVFLMASAALAQTTQPADQPVGHRFVCTDNALNKIFVVSAEGKIEWEYPARVPQDVWVMPDGSYLFTHVRGVMQVTPDKKVVWEYKSPEGTEIHACQPLPDGGVMVAENGTKRIIELDKGGKITKEISLPTTTAGVHMHYRMARKLANGNYLVAYVGEHALKEFDSEGKLIKTIPTPGDVFVGVRLPNGNTLAGCGDGHKLVEFNPEGKIVWEIGENDLPGNPLRFVAGVQRLPNGNTVVCNWGGHGHVGKQPLIFEVTPDKKVVWQFEDHKQFRTISNLQVMDVKGAPLR